MIIKDYPILIIVNYGYNTLNVIKNTESFGQALPTPLDAQTLSQESLEAAQAFSRAGIAANTVRSYQSALRYWAAWLQLRYGMSLTASALSEKVAVQFILDHLARPVGDGSWQHLLPSALDQALVAAKVKGQLGALRFSTVSHRLAVLAKWHRLNNWPNPLTGHATKSLLKEAKKAQVRNGLATHKKTAAVLEPLQAMLATCTDGVRGVRDKALLLLAWSGGGRRRSEVVTLKIEDLRQLDSNTWLYSLGNTKTNSSGINREKPISGPAASALKQWLECVGEKSGPLFRRLHRGGSIGAKALSADHVARIVKRRAQLAGLQGDWGAHSLRSGFVTEAARQGVPLGEVMAMTEHRSINTVMGYFQAGSLLNSRAASLMPDPEDQ